MTDVRRHPRAELRRDERAAEEQDAPGFAHLAVRAQDPHEQADQHDQDGNDCNHHPQTVAQLERIANEAFYDAAVLTVLRCDPRYSRGFQRVAIEQELEKYLSSGPLDDAIVYRAIRARACRLFARLWVAGEVVVWDDRRVEFAISSPTRLMLPERFSALNMPSEAVENFELYMAIRTEWRLQRARLGHGPPRER